MVGGSPEAQQLEEIRLSAEASLEEAEVRGHIQPYRGDNPFPTIVHCCGVYGGYTLMG